VLLLLAKPIIFLLVMVELEVELMPMVLRETIHHLIVPQMQVMLLLLLLREEEVELEQETLLMQLVEQELIVQVI